mmetsp:Transcript_42955/g.93526  ORF Transcript_42955/g.93526 Transcript_42955/m.93526 type:complete len:283 (-) Transcript_42955:49-897(-)
MRPGAVVRALRPKDAIVQDLINLVERKEVRHSRKRCVVAGTKLVQDLGRRYRFLQLLSKHNDPAAEAVQAEVKHAAEVWALRRIAGLVDFEGLIGTLDLPAPSKDLGDTRLLLCIDYVEDPGALGTLLRTAVAFQWQAVFFLPHCADPFDAKCIRASQGALFEIPHRRGNMEDLQRLCKRRGLQLSVPHPQGEDIGAATYVPPPRGMAMLLREEYVAPWSPPRVARKLRIPDPWRHRAEPASDGPFDPRALDVAVAGGILMHHIKHFHYPQVSRSPFLASPA